jgi:hypothetical protein
MATAARRATIALLVVAIAALVVVVGARAVWNAVQRHTIAAQCTAGAYALSPDQASVASMMASVVITRELPERAAVLALAAGLQESKLRNLPPGGGDRDSVGVLQQRPSQGWGSQEQLTDVRFATGAFLVAVQRVPHWQSDPLTEVVQAVQISAVPEGYARWEGQAQALADALMGTTPAGLSCTYPAPTQVATAAEVASALSADLPVKTPDASKTTVSVPDASWRTSAWFVANGERLGLETVSYAGKKWHRASGWKSDPAAAPNVVVATLHT